MTGVYVVTHLEMGWDCVCGVYTSEEGAIRSCFDDNEDGLSYEVMKSLVDEGDISYIVHYKTLSCTL